MVTILRQFGGIIGLSTTYSLGETDWVSGTLTYLIFNNHPRGQGVANALEMLSRLTDQRPALPEGLKRAFPRLAYF